MVKKIAYTTVSCFIGFFILVEYGIAQQRIIDRTFQIDDAKKIHLNLKFGESITVKTWDKKEVSFHAVIEINNGKLNDALILDFNKTAGGLAVQADYDNELIKKGRKEDCTGRNFSTYSSNKNGSHNVMCSKVVYEIVVPRNTDLEVESLSADIELHGLQGPIRAKSISGFVDLSWPQEQDAEFTMKTISGEVYSGLDKLAMINQKGSVPLVGYELHGSIGSGGPRVDLESISGDIYLRKEN